jgi:hypothetical protein
VKRFFTRGLSHLQAAMVPSNPMENAGVSSSSTGLQKRCNVVFDVRPRVFATKTARNLLISLKLHQVGEPTGATPGAGELSAKSLDALVGCRCS